MKFFELELNFQMRTIQVSYDTAKHWLLRMGMPDDTGLHFSAGLSAGFAATVLGSPWDVIGTRLMARPSAEGEPLRGTAFYTL